MNHNKEVQKLYTRKAKFYHFLFVNFLGFGKRVENLLREIDYVQPHFKILDAGCGTGNATRVLYTIAQEKGYINIIFHAFDLTQAMLDLFWQWIKKIGAKNILLKQADVLVLEKLPADWSEYDRIVSLAMLEYLPKDKIKQALGGLKKLLKNDGKLLVVITRRNFFTLLFIDWWWKAHVYNEQELKEIFRDVGFDEFKIINFFGQFMFAIEAKK